jgi:ABC-2 type transport system permease protein
MMNLKRSLYTIYIFTRLNTRRFFRDRLAIFFTILFPLIFLFVFGGIFGKSGASVSFNVAIVDNAHTSYSKQYIHILEASKTFKVDKSVTTVDAAQSKMTKSQLDATIVLPSDYGTVKPGMSYPSGTAQVIYTQNNAQAGQTLITVLQGVSKDINSKLVTNTEPFTAVGKQSNLKSLTQFDYTFAGLLGFAIIGMGIFGPVNVFPELKKQGILRRLHTTPLKISEYFVSTMISQAVIGLVSLAVMFIVAIGVFHLKVIGNYFEIVPFLVLSIISILGIGLAIGGWAKNERQAAPLSNIVVFPMMFLSGTFFPRFLMPHWLQTVSGFLPLSPVIDGIRLMTTEGKHLVDIGPQLGIIGIWVVIIYIIAFRVFRWE